MIQNNNCDKITQGASPKDANNTDKKIIDVLKQIEGVKRTLLDVLKDSHK